MKPVKKNVSFALLFYLVCFLWGTVSAEETVHGRYIYATEAVSPKEGRYSLRAEYLPAAEPGEQTEPEILVGAEFGVYVISGDGEPVPWANPLHPWESMRLRTDEIPIRFSLPEGMDFYLRQETAPEGILFDPTALIPITDKDILVQNEEEGELIVSARDSLGNPLPGTVFSVRDGAQIHTLTADENGVARYPVRQTQLVSISETELPKGVFDAIQVQISGEESVSLHPETWLYPATRTSAEFVHPAAGLVEIRWSVSGPDENGILQEEPLSGVAVTIGNGEISLLTDEVGETTTEMLEGRYPISFSYSGNDAILSVERGEIVVESGATTLIELMAKRPEGRIRIKTDLKSEGSSFSLQNEESGEEYGPFSMEGSGTSDLLPQGRYRVFLEMPEEDSVAGWRENGLEEQQGKPESISVAAGVLTELELSLKRLETRTLSVATLRINDDGSYKEDILTDAIALTLFDTNGNDIGTFHAEKGKVLLSAANGFYMVRMDEDVAEELGLQEVSDSFSLSEETNDRIVFRQDTARIIVQSRDRDGLPLTGGVYRISGAGGTEQTVVSDATGRGVSMPILPGQIRIETITSPDGYAETESMTVTAEAGVVTNAVLTHAAWGKADFLVRVQSLDVRANPMNQPLPNKEIFITSAEDPSFLSCQTIRTNAEGEATVRLKAGDYLAKLADESDKEIIVRDTVSFHLENETHEMVLMNAYASKGGVRLILNGDSEETETVNLRFSLLSAEGTRTEFQMSENYYFVTGLSEGVYLLEEDSSSSAHPALQNREVLVKGGEVTEVKLSLQKYASLSVSKTGLTFTRSMQTYSVPLTGEYLIYRMENGKLIPYPSEKDQYSVWANTGDTDGTRPSEVQLPAEPEGTLYYLRETGTSAGFTADDETHEVLLRAGESVRPVFAVASDRGFFRLSVMDAESNAPLGGSSFVMLDGNGNEILSFTAGKDGYTNDVALPVGTYTLRQLSAPEGYALSESSQMQVSIESWLADPDSEADVTVYCIQIPTDAILRTKLSLWQPDSPGRNSIGVDVGMNPKGMRLLRPELVMRTSAQQGKRLNIRSVTISNTTDRIGNTYQVRLEYALRNGGWQSSKALLTETLDIPRTISLDSAGEDIEAVRLTFLRTDSGEELAEEGFIPGQVILTLDAEGNEETSVLLHAEASGVFLYSHTPGVAHAIPLSSSEEKWFDVAGSSNFGAESGGRDGNISGVAFLDTDADGVLDLSETGRYAGLTVRLLDAGGESMEVTRTDSQGRYAFRNISGGVYRLQFSGGDSLVYSRGSFYSDHVISHVEDSSGLTDSFTIDADHTDFIRNAGCVYAAALDGDVYSVQGDGELIGMSGMSITLRRLVDEGESDARIAITEDDGSFSFFGLFPDDYLLEVNVPDGYLMPATTDSAARQIIHLKQGEMAVAEEIRIIRAAAVDGMIWSDEDGDGLLSEPVQPVAGIPVRILSVLGAETSVLKEVLTDETGSFRFDGILPGEYRLQAELKKGYAFSRNGDHSEIFGAVGLTGNTNPFVLAPGEQREDVLIGVTRPGQIEIRTFADERGDGVWGSYDEGLAGVMLQLIRLESGKDADALSAVTDSEGSAVFESISPGTYVVSYEMPGLWRTTRIPEHAGEGAIANEVAMNRQRTGRSEPLLLLAGESRVLVIGATITGSISGTAFLDANANGSREENEIPMPGISVELLDGEKNVQEQAVTDDNGAYHFEGLPSGRYTIRFLAPDEFGFSGTERTAQSGSAESTTDSVTQTRPITLAAGKSFEMADAALVRLASLSGMIWEDANADGKWDENENRCDKVSVDLMNAAGRIILRTAETDENGIYRFDRLMAGNYTLRVLLPDGYVFSEEESRVFSIANLRGKYGYSASFALSSGEAVEHADFGIFMEGVISGILWQDDGFNGIMDAEESGIRGVDVILLGESGNELTQVQTDRKGAFRFEKVNPGNYWLEVRLPEKYVFTANGGDSLIPRSDQSTATVWIGTLAMGQKIEDIRIGALIPASLSGTIWYDEDDDGRMRYGENGLSDVLVTLRMTAGNDAGRRIETKTGADGNYLLTGLMPGTAILTYQLPEGYAFARNTAGRNRVSTVSMADTTKTDSEPFTISAGNVITDRDVGAVRVGTVNGHLHELGIGEGHQDHLGISGANVQLIDADSGSVLREMPTDENGAFDFSFVRKGHYSLRMELPEAYLFTEGQNSSFAQTDSAQQTTDPFSLLMGESKNDLDACCVRAARMDGKISLLGTEEGVDGAVVSLLSGGTVIRSTVTDSSGGYSFDKLRPGTYRIRYELPDNALFAENQTLILRDPDDLEAETNPINLEAGETAEVKLVSAVWGSAIRGTAWLDRNADGHMDAVEDRLSDVLVHLLDENGTAISSARTGTDGQYAFTRLREGTYRLFFTLPDGMLFTDKITGVGSSCITPMENSEGLSEAMPLAMGWTQEDTNVGAIEPGEIGDTVWLDENGNGLQDYREPLLSGVTLRLIRMSQDGEVLDVREIQSDMYGYFHFRALRPGRYRLQVETQDGDELTVHTGVPLGEIDSDPLPETGESDIILLESGQILRNVDVGFLHMERR